MIKIRSNRSKRGLAWLFIWYYDSKRFFGTQNIKMQSPIALKWRGFQHFKM